MRLHKAMGKEGATYDTRLDVKNQIKLAMWMEKNRAALEPLSHEEVVELAKPVIGQNMSVNIIRKAREGLGWPSRMEMIKRAAKTKEKTTKGSRAENLEMRHRLSIMEKVLLSVTEWATRNGWEPPLSRAALISNIRKNEDEKNE